MDLGVLGGELSDVDTNVCLRGAGKDLGKTEKKGAEKDCNKRATTFLPIDPDGKVGSPQTDQRNGNAEKGGGGTMD